MAGRPRVLVVSLSDLGRDPRVHRQIDALRGEFEVAAAAFAPSPLEGVEFIPLASWIDVAAEQQRARGSSVRGLFATVARAVIRRALMARALLAPRSPRWWVGRTDRWLDAVPRFTPQLKLWERALAGVEFDVVVVNDALFLPLASRLAAQRPIVFDAHEYVSEQFAALRAWRWFQRPYVRYLVARWLPRVDAMMAVAHGIAARYEADTGVQSTVVTNATALYELSPTPAHEPLRLVHWGGADPQRQLELMIEAVLRLRRPVSFDLVLVGDPDYVAQLERVAGGDPRIRFRQPVPMPELPHFGNDYDVGVYLLPPRSANHELALPNKLFEFLQARLAVAIGPSVEMARIVREWDAGVVADDFSVEALARAIEELDPSEVERYKRNADAAARVLNAEANAEAIRDVVRTALARRSGAPAMSLEDLARG